MVGSIKGTFKCLIFQPQRRQHKKRENKIQCDIIQRYFNLRKKEHMETCIFPCGCRLFFLVYSQDLQRFGRDVYHDNCDIKYAVTKILVSGRGEDFIVPVTFSVFLAKDGDTLQCVLGEETKIKSTVKIHSEVDRRCKRSKVRKPKSEERQHKEKLNRNLRFMISEIRSKIGQCINRKIRKLGRNKILEARKRKAEA